MCLNIAFYSEKEKEENKSTSINSHIYWKPNISYLGIGKILIHWMRIFKGIL